MGGGQSESALRQGDRDYNEHTFRTALENLLNAFKPTQDINIIHEPKSKQGQGNIRPDFKVFRQMQGYESLIGFIECKNFGVDLSPLIKGKQIEKYLSVCHNIILTDYNRFILLSYGKVIDDFVLFDSLDSLPQAKLIESTTRFSHLLSKFFDTKVQITRKEALATILATQSFYLSSVINEAQSDESFKKYLGDSHQSFRYLESTDVSIAEFCDILSQSIVYGMFVAHIDNESFEIDKIPVASFAMLLPEHFTTLMEFIARSLPATLPQSIQYALSNIIKTIALIDKPSLATSFQKEISEVSIYLYEDFLKKYDKLRGTNKKEGGGVYYTPEPIVNMIVRSIDELLQTHFGKSFSDESVKVLDFATGTGSFLAKVFESILENQSAVFTKQTIINKCFKDIYGFEISFVPYIVAHLKLSSILRTQGFSEFSAHQKFQVYLTNTLDLDSHEDNQKAFTQYSELKNERDKSLQLKHKEDLLVILGNPPYSGKSKNKSDKILSLMQDYKEGVKNRRNLSDDYIKFIRFAQWKLLEQNQKSGIMGFITNNSYLYGRTHRKMRESLAKTFDEIYILNLHGHNEIDGKNDKNVFDIRSVGVCISLFVKYANSNTNATSCHTDASSCHTERSEVSKEKNQICHTEGEARSISNIRNKDISLSVKAQYDKSTVIANERSECGNPKNNDKLAQIHYFSTKDNEILRRADKFALLNDIANNGLKTIKWQNLKLDSPYFWFVPKDLSDSEYENFWALAKETYSKTKRQEGENKSLETKAIFNNHNSGIEANKGDVTIQFTKEQMRDILQDFIFLDTQQLATKYNLIDARDWKIDSAKKDVEENKNCLESKIQKIAFTPFDFRYTFLSYKSKRFLSYPRYDMTQNFLLCENFGVSFQKGINGQVFITNKMIDGNFLSARTSITPLYRFIDSENEVGKVDKTPNFTKEFNDFKATHKVLKSKSPEQILAFIYGNLYNPAYRAKYVEYLKIGFPRVDFEVTQSKFESLANLGQNLIDLHLMKTIPQDKSIDLVFSANANKSNPNFTLDKPKYENEKIVLNADLEIAGVSAEVWDYTIGGYKVLDKWLNCRTGLTLEQSDFTHILNVAKILKATIAIQAQLAQI
ncbi:type ISP restriction/modification enzyme [Helicobacter sp. 23-1046]